MLLSPSGNKRCGFRFNRKRWNNEEKARNPRRLPDRPTATERRIDDGARTAPDTDASLAEQDWDPLASGELVPESVSENGDIRYQEDAPDVPLGEDDDNAYQESDEALPDDEEEAAISRHSSQEGSRFDEI
jgi:hypothetical protein